MPTSRMLTMAALAAFLAAPTSARADDFICLGTTGAISVDNVKVPSGADCVLEGTRVHGNVKVENGGSLVTQFARVDGNVQSEGAVYLQILEDTFVGGSVQIKYTTSTALPGVPNLVCASKINGNLELTENYAPFDIGDAGCSDGNHIGGQLQLKDHRIPGGFGTPYALTVARNRIEGNLQLDDNRSSGGDFNIVFNRIFENLQCVDNDPKPIGGGNVVYGVAQEQCADLASGPMTSSIDAQYDKENPKPAVQCKKAKKAKKLKKK